MFNKVEYLNLVQEKLLSKAEEQYENTKVMPCTFDILSEIIRESMKEYSTNEVVKSLDYANQNIENLYGFNKLSFDNPFNLKSYDEVLLYFSLNNYLLENLPEDWSESLIKILIH